MQRLYIIFDTVAQAFVLGMVVQRHDAPVIRQFYDLLEGNETLGKHPADYELRAVAFIADDGTISGFDHPETIATGKGWLISKGEQNVQA